MQHKTGIKEPKLVDIINKAMADNKTMHAGCGKCVVKGLRRAQESAIGRNWNVKLLSSGCPRKCKEELAKLLDKLGREFSVIW